MKHINNRVVIRDDKLIFMVREKGKPDTVYCQRKRLPANTCTERLQDRDKYFELRGETVPFLSYLRNKYAWSLAEGVEYILLITGRPILTKYIL